jgi:hypothetical protein
MIPPHSRASEEQIRLADVAAWAGSDVVAWEGSETRLYTVFVPVERHDDCAECITPTCPKCTQIRWVSLDKRPGVGVLGQTDGEGRGHVMLLCAEHHAEAWAETLRC